MEVTMTEKEKYHPLTPAEEPKFTPTEITDKILRGVAFNESRGKEAPYTFQQPSGDEAMGDAIGKYQITEGELASYGEKFLGFKVKPGWFLNEPEWQDTYMKNKIAFLESEGLDIPEILALHRAGISGWGDPVRVRAKVLERGAYIQSALEYMKTL